LFICSLTIACSGFLVDYSVATGEAVVATDAPVLTAGEVAVYAGAANVEVVSEGVLDYCCCLLTIYCND
jgi:hypothetical protein